MADTIRMQDVVFAYEPGLDVLRVADFRVEEGKRVFLYGPSGSGKTTLLGLVTGILTPSSGQCEVLGRDMASLTSSRRDQLRGSELGYIFQSFNLIPYLSVAENIELPCRIHAARRSRIRARTLRQETLRIARRLELEDLLERSVTRLSTGQQQRVAIARAVIGRPRLVIADEPTSALDTDRRDRFLELLFDVCDEAGATLIFVSHDRSLRARFTEQVSMAEINALSRLEEAHA